ncbi:MAG: GldG family protein [Acidobacteriota bacterium]|nr:GldG family protein [Acidobacteriota bacterium]
MSKRLTALVLTATLVSLRPVGAQTRVGIDEGHFNVHTATTTYLPFVEALRAAGFTVTSTTERFSAESLADLDVLVIANARASSTGPLEERGKPAFSAAELEGIESWVRKGGGLLLVVDHYPVGGANAQLGLRFGIDILNGRTVDRALARTEIAGRVALSAGGSAETNEHLIFESASKTLGAHPILCRAGQEVNRVATFGGTSLSTANGATPLLILTDSAVDYVGADRVPRSAAGRSQALALQVGRGRVVVLGEAAALFNIDNPAMDNLNFAVNTVAWLGGQRLICAIPGSRN